MSNEATGDIVKRIWQHNTSTSASRNDPLASPYTVCKPIQVPFIALAEVQNQEFGRQGVFALTDACSTLGLRIHNAPNIRTGRSYAPDSSFAGSASEATYVLKPGLWRSASTIA